MNNLKLLSKRCHEAFWNLKNPVFMRVFSVFWYYSHSLTSSFPQLLFALFWANFREISLVLLRFSLYSLCSQPVWYCFGIKVWYQFSEKTAEKKSVILFQQVILGSVLQFNWLWCLNTRLDVKVVLLGNDYIIAGICKQIKFGIYDIL